MSSSPSSIPKQLLPFVDLVQRHQQVLILGPMPSFSLPPRGIPTLVVDGGLIHLTETSPFVFVGDLDSTPSKLVKLVDSAQACWKLPGHKNASDLTYALSLLPDNLEHIVMRGFQGGRVDHFFMVLGELAHRLKNFSRAQVDLDEGLFAYPSGERTIEINGGFSLFSLEPNEMKITGQVEYPLDSQTMLYPGQSLTLSNQATGPVSITSTSPYFLQLF